LKEDSDVDLLFTDAVDPGRISDVEFVETAVAIDTAIIIYKPYQRAELLETVQSLSKRNLN